MYHNQLKNCFFRFFFLFITCLCNGQIPVKQSVRISHLIDSISLQLENNYIFPDKAQLIAKHLRAQSNKGAYKSFSADAQKLASKIQADIYSIHRDRHMVVGYNPSWQGHRQGYKGPSEEEAMQFKRFLKENNFIFKKVELLRGDIGYFPSIICGTCKGRQTRHSIGFGVFS